MIRSQENVTCLRNVHGGHFWCYIIFLSVPYCSVSCLCMYSILFLYLSDCLYRSCMFHTRYLYISGVYGMWNLYVVGLLILFAPSNKKLPQDERMLPQDESSKLDATCTTNHNKCHVTMELTVSNTT